MHSIQSGRGQPHSKTLRSKLRSARQRLGLRLSSAALDDSSFVGLIFLASLLTAGGFEEDFSQDPAMHGWNIFGETNLFHWNSANQKLDVTWDSSKGNSY